MKITRASRIRTLVGGLVAAGALALAAAPASAATLSSGVFTGNACNRTEIFDATSITGAKACINHASYSYGKSKTIQLIAADTKSDGHSARTEVQILQRTRTASGGYTWKLTHQFDVTDSSGYNTSRIGSAVTFSRLTGADQYEIRYRAATYESGSKTYVNWGNWTSTINPWEPGQLL